MLQCITSVLLLAAVAAAAAAPFQGGEEFKEEDLPEIFRELSERHSRIERFSKEFAKQTNANRESAVLQSAILPRPPINEPVDNRLPDLPERSTVETTKSIETGHTDYETESVIASPPPPHSSEADEKKHLLSERFFQTSTESNQPRARAAPTLPSPNVLPLSTPASVEPSTTTPPTTTTTPFPTTRTTPPTTPRAEEEEEEREHTVTLPSVRRTTPHAIRGLRPLSFPPLPKFLPTRRNALPERNAYRL